MKMLMVYAYLIMFNFYQYCKFYSPPKVALINTFSFR